MASRPFTRRQSLQNARFLAALAESGNARLAARALGLHRSTFTKRRAKSAAFTAQWDAALATAHAALNPPRDGEGDRVKRGGGGAGPGNSLRTLGGEPIVTRTKSGRLQLRRARPGRMTKAAEQAFLRALSATANVRLAAAAAGFAHSSFYAKKRSSPAFAREFRLALAMGYEQLEMALVAAGVEGGAEEEDGAWRSNEPPPVPPMSVNQALQLMYLHQKEARLWHEPDYIKRRRGESDDAHSFRLAVMYRAREQRDRDAYEVAEAAREAARERPCNCAAPLCPACNPPTVPTLPDLAQVTGWSPGGELAPPDWPGPEEKTGPDYNRDIALFGGWRLEDWEERKEREEREGWGGWDGT